MWRFITRQMLRQWPRWATYVCGVTHRERCLRRQPVVWPEMQAYPFFFYFPAVFLTAVLFDHGSGYGAAVLAPSSSRFSLSPG